MIAGRGAPEVSQCKMMDMPSITALSEGPAVMFGAIPVAEKEASETHMYIFKNQTHTNTHTHTHTHTNTHTPHTPQS